MSPQLVMATALAGRRAEIAVLQQQLERVLRGSGTVLLVSGEAGIGKSRLIRELQQLFEQATAADGRPGLVLRGQCYETDQTLPYAPLLDLLRSMLARQSPTEIAATLGDEAAELANLLPELTTVLPLDPSPSRVGEQAEKQRLFQALLRLFARLARRSPLLIAVEDLHWSDDTSLELLLHLARRLSDLPILLVLSYRSDEVQPTLRHSLASLDRERLAEEIHLSRLTPNEVDAMLRSIFGQPQAIQSDFLQAICALTDGNPFFVEEVLRALIASGDIFQTGGRWDRKELAQIHVPRSIQDAVARRTERLGPQALDVLRLAAVAGRVFDFVALEELTAYSESMLLEIMRELIGAQLVVEESADRFAFRHALTRQAVYAQLLGRERRAMHQTIGETLERLHGPTADSHLADLAYHFAVAEDWPRTLGYARRAGDHALRLFTPGAAAEHFSRAIDAAIKLGDIPPVELYRSRARAYGILGAFDLADRDRQTVLKMARAAGDRAAEWRGLLDLGELWVGLDYARAGEYLEQALALARTLGEPVLIADSLTQFGGWLINREQVGPAEHVLEDALDIYSDLGDQHGIAQTVDLLGTAADIGGNMARMHQRYQRAVTLFRQLDDRPGISSSLATDCIRAGAIGLLETLVPVAGSSLAEVIAETDEAAALAHTMDWRAGEAYAAVVSSSCLGWFGSYADAFMRASIGLTISAEIEHREWMTGSHYMLGSLWFDLLDSVSARSHFEQAAALSRESGSLFWLNLTTAGLADATSSLGSLDEAEALLASIPADLPMETLSQRRVWLARTRLALERGDSPIALQVLDRLIASAENVTQLSDLPILAWLRGRALQETGDLDAAEAALDAALRGAEARAMGPLLWRVHHALAQVYVATDRLDDGDAEMSRARALIEQLAEETPDAETRATFLAATDSIRPRTSSQPVVRDASLLTARERDVALLLARGLSNREIAANLFVGDRTIETHVGNILAKLGLRSRTQVATWAIETGLANKLEPPT